MGLTKVTYVDNKTVISAKNLNDIQDAIVALETDADNAVTMDQVNTAINTAVGEAIGGSY